MEWRDVRHESRRLKDSGDSKGSCLLGVPLCAGTAVLSPGLGSVLLNVKL